MNLKTLKTLTLRLTTKTRTRTKTKMQMRGTSWLQALKRPLSCCKPLIFFPSGLEPVVGNRQTTQPTQSTETTHTCTQQTDKRTLCVICSCSLFSFFEMLLPLVLLPFQLPFPCRAYFNRLHWPEAVALFNGQQISLVNFCIFFFLTMSVCSRICGFLFTCLYISQRAACLLAKAILYFFVYSESSIIRITSLGDFFSNYRRFPN